MCYNTHQLISRQHNCICYKELSVSQSHSLRSTIVRPFQGDGRYPERVCSIWQYISFKFPDVLRRYDTLWVRGLQAPPRDHLSSFDLFHCSMQRRVHGEYKLRGRGIQ